MAIYVSIKRTKIAKAMWIAFKELALFVDN
jgi:hypothetical protein